MANTSPIPPDKQVNHLILLIGGNPLPNAVAGSLLIQEDSSKPRIISLIHSVETEPIAKRLCIFLQERPNPPQVCLFGPDGEEGLEPLETSPELIKHYVQQADEAAREQYGQAIVLTGLNYTGGTKAMSLYAFAALENRKLILSYLDARTHTMHFDPKPVNQPFVGNTLEIPLESLLALTKWKLQHGETPLIRKDSLLLEIIGQTVEHVSQSSKALKPEQVRQFIEDKLPDEAFHRASMSESWCTENGFSSVGTFNKWINGGFWLENYVLSVLREQVNLSLHSCHANIEAYLQGGSSENHFELDVVIMHGYQLFVFSCTTKRKRSDLKLKLVEATLRAQQLGGDEARSALVCFYDINQDEDHPTPDLEDEVNAEIAQDGKVKVFGRKDLMRNRFPQRVTEWIKQQSKI